MKKPAANGTIVYQRQHSRGPTLPQLNAIDLLAAGKTDKETAELLNLSRTCVTKWRLYDPVFQAALNQRRAEVWSAGADRLRSLIPKALDALGEELEKPGSPNRKKAAGEVLRLVPLSGALAIGPTDAEEIVRRMVEELRRQARGAMDDFVDETERGLPPFDRHLAETRRALEKRLQEPEAEVQPTSHPPAADGNVESAG
jgi:hypothetical protein